MLKVAYKDGKEVPYILLQLISCKDVVYWTANLLLHEWSAMVRESMAAIPVVDVWHVKAIG